MRPTSSRPGRAEDRSCPVSRSRNPISLTTKGCECPRISSPIHSYMLPPSSNRQGHVVTSPPAAPEAIDTGPLTPSCRYNLSEQTPPAFVHSALPPRGMHIMSGRSFFARSWSFAYSHRSSWVSLTNDLPYHSPIPYLYRPLGSVVFLFTEQLLWITLCCLSPWVFAKSSRDTFPPMFGATELPVSELLT